VIPDVVGQRRESDHAEAPQWASQSKLLDAGIVAYEGIDKSHSVMMSLGTKYRFERPNRISNGQNHVSTDKIRDKNSVIWPYWPSKGTPNFLGFG
jgi:hypothetical protein